MVVACELGVYLEWRRGIDELIVYDLWEYVRVDSEYADRGVVALGTESLQATREEARSQWGRCRDLWQAGEIAGEADGQRLVCDQDYVSAQRLLYPLVECSLDPALNSP